MPKILLKSKKARQKLVYMSTRLPLRNERSGKKSEMQSKYDSHIGKNNINGPIMSIIMKLSNFTCY